jgi:hypothetical protein
MGGGRRRVVTRHSRSLGNFAVGMIAVIGYALLCGMLYLR